MKLLDDFFNLIELTESKLGVIAVIKLNPEHIIYSSHFPGFPVTPGVIQLQIIHEILEKYLKRKVRLLEIKDCKFLKVINPNEINLLNIRFTISNKEEYISVKANVVCESEIYFKINSVYIKM